MSSVGYWLGTPGNLVRLPRPNRGLSDGDSLPGSTVALLSGGTGVDYLGTPRGQWQLAWSLLTETDRSIVDAFIQGTYGRGALLLLDPNRPNLAPADQASPTSVTGGVTALTQSHGSQASVSTPVGVGRRVVQWTPGTLSTAGRSFAQLAFPLVSAAPAIAGITYCAVASARLVSGAASARAELVWWDSAGAFLSVTSGSSSVLSTSAWTVLGAVTGTPPANAVYVGARIATPTTGSAPVFLGDAIALRAGVSSLTYRTGRGSPRVVVLPDSSSSTRLAGEAGRQDRTLTLAEA